MAAIEPPQLDGPSGSKNALTSWVLWVLALAVAAIFTVLINTQSSLVESKDKEIDRKETELRNSRQETSDARKELRECNEENKAMLQQYSILPGRKTLVITPAEAQN